MTTVATKAVAAPKKTLPELLNDPETKKRFADMLGKDARSFSQNIMTVYNTPGDIYKECEPNSIIAGASISASVGLSILPSMGESCLVPYRDNKGGVVLAQWQIMTRGVVTLALRSGQYKKVNLAPVYEGQLISYDEFKGNIKLDSKSKKSDLVMGFYFYFGLLNGQEQEYYLSSKQAIEHGLRYSKSFQNGKGRWTEDPQFEKAGSVKKWLAGQIHLLTYKSGAYAMGSKTLVKNSLLKWGPLETRIKEVIQLDQAVIGDDGKPDYIDTVADTDDEPKTYTAPPPAEKNGKMSAADKIKWAREATGKQGLPAEQFDAWIAKQGKTDAAKAKAAKDAWDKVAQKKATIEEAFSVVEEKESEFEIYSVAKTEYFGDPVFLVRESDAAEEKYFTSDKSVYDYATKAKKEGVKVIVTWVDKERDREITRWIKGIKTV